jgi:hypothetical protein
MSDFNEFFEALQQSIASDDFVKLTISKPRKKSEGLQNVYVRFFMTEGKQVYEFKYRHITENVFKKLALVAAKAEIEKLLLNTFRTATLFTLSYDLLVMVSKTKQVSCRDTAPSFRNKLPEFSQESQEPKESSEPKEW